MSYTVKLVSAADIDDVVTLWTLAFSLYVQNPEESETNFESCLDYFNNDLAFCYGAYDGTRLVATAGVLPYEMHLGGRFVPVGAVAAVATIPEHRRRGLVQLLMTECLKRLHDERVPVASLWPFAYPFYERLGWATTTMQYEVSLALSTPHKLGDSRRYRIIPVSEFALAADVHKRWIGAFSQSMTRPDTRWRRMLTHPLVNCKMFLHEDGYMVWNLKEAGDTLNVREWAYVSEGAFLDGLELMGQMDSQFSHARFVCGDVEPLLKLGVFEPVPEIKLKPGMMTRVVNLDAFMELCPEGSLRPPVNDPLNVAGQNADGIGPGAVMQLATGFWRQPPDGPESSLAGMLAGKPAFCAEKY